MSFVIEVENIKCSGCTNSIKTKLLKLTGVENVDIDVSAGLVTIEAENDLKQEVVILLESLGYPEVGSIAGLKSVKAKAKSFVSCAIGSMTENTDNKESK